MRIAGIDIGTNSVLLLVVEVRGPALVPLVDRATITRLGRGVDASRNLSPEGLARTLACLADYGAEARALGVSALAAVATSAARDAGNGAELLDAAEGLLGVRPAIVDGDEEAALTFAGALSGLALPGARVAVLDVGGGSTEIVLGRAPGGAGPGAVEAAVSLDVGAVRLSERHVRTDPPAPSELDAVRAEVRAALARAPSVAGVPLVGVAGTVTTLAAIVGGVVPYDGARIHGSRLAATELERLGAELAARSLAERRLVPGLEPARADVIVAGALIVGELVRAAGAAELVVSDRGVRWGLVERLVRR
ncbi:MAG: Ppx/GppA family phosphatase [Polyangiaceae bacterium]|nr:Ppx/GppA family phosphatase [Polyangiaceae bacterium]